MHRTSKFLSVSVHFGGGYDGGNFMNGGFDLTP